MHGSITNDISNFYVAGVNYKKTDATVRGQYAIDQVQYAGILAIAPSYGSNELFILSTCNRTEIYGFAENASQLIHLLCSQTIGDEETFLSLAYIKKGVHAVEHLFNVAAGLDSQILGDYEIVGQIKQAVKFSRSHNFIGSNTDRLINLVFQSSKVIKNQTALSGGTVSVSFAAVQYIKKKMQDVSGKRILLLGVGKIGRNTCKNLVDYLGTDHITLINRTVEKAAVLANELGLHYASPEELDYYISASDVIIVATNAATPTILKSDLQNKGSKLVIDLSIPCNVEATAAELPGVTLVSVDELSKMKDETVKKREAEVPKARAIINTHMSEFLDWYEMRKHIHVLKAVKHKLQEINSKKLFLHHIPLASDNPHANIQKVINVMALKMRRHNSRGCHYIEAINDFMAAGAN